MAKSLEDKGSTQENSLGQANYAMIFFGVGEILGCFFIGWVVDKYGSYKATVVNCIIMTAMGIVTVIYAIVYDFGILAFAMCFLWGFQDSAVNTHSQEILGFEFENNSEPFSVFNIAQCIATAFFSLVQIWIDTQQSYIIYAIFIFILGFGSVANTLRFKFREQDRKDMIVMNDGNDNRIKPRMDEVTKDIELDD